MNAFSKKLLQDIAASYWLIPAVLTVGAILLALAMRWLDVQIDFEDLVDIKWIDPTPPAGARTIMSVIAGAVLGVAGVTFSITIVAVSFASTNYGPRLIANFMRDRGNQTTLGIFIGTFAYCLVTLRTMQDADTGLSGTEMLVVTPHFAVFAALMLALISIAALIYYIHHVPETINISNIAAKIGKDLCEALDEPFPAVSPPRIPAGAEGLSWKSPTGSLKRVGIEGVTDGYIQTIDIDRIYRVAQNRDVLVELHFRPGDFVTASDTVLEVWSSSEISDDCLGELDACFAIGRERTVNQNLLFLVDQLVEIIARALSPGVNDPFTAMTCLNWLGAATARLLQRGGFDTDTTGVAGDQGDSALVRVPPLTTERFLRDVFDRTRPYIRTDRTTTIHALELMDGLATGTPDPEHGKQLKKYADLLRRDGIETFGDLGDLPAPS